MEENPLRLFGSHMDNLQHQTFISERLVPLAGSADPASMSAGEPGLPTAFTWRGKPLAVAAVRRKWRETGLCRNGSNEAYLRKHWYEVEIADGRVARLYFERQGRPPNRRQRWWLYSIGE